MITEDQRKEAVEESKLLNLEEVLNLIDHNKHYEGLEDIDVVAYEAAERILKEQAREIFQLKDAGVCKVAGIDKLNTSRNYGTFCVGNFDELVDAVKNLPLKDQKDLAEDILLGFYELGWDVAWSEPDLMVSKTEEL